MLPAGGTLTNGVCACPNDAQGYPQDFNGTICERTMIVKLCLSASATATWNFVSGSCVCNQEGYNFDTATGKCVESPEAKAAREAAEAKNKIKSAHDAISALANAKKTVWRDEEGKFNTARLASDSIAGVVLGTTGALVTSHLVKKKQTEDGFEALECTIGGQTVAGWGDEFSVGIGE